MAKNKADIQEIKEEGSGKFLITMPDFYNIDDEAEALADAIEDVRHRVLISRLSDQKLVGPPPKEGFIPFRYEINPDTYEVRLVSVVMAFS